jgi:hypothetical protein
MADQQRIEEEERPAFHRREHDLNLECPLLDLPRHRQWQRGGHGEQERGVREVAPTDARHIERGLGPPWLLAVEHPERIVSLDTQCEAEGHRQQEESSERVEAECTARGVGRGKLGGSWTQPHAGDRRIVGNGVPDRRPRARRRDRLPFRDLILMNHRMNDDRILIRPGRLRCF